MARVDSLGHFLTDVADAIRTKGGTSETIQASTFDTAIENLPSGGGADLSEYFYTTIDTNTTSSNNMTTKTFKKLPDMTVASNVTSLSYAYYKASFEIPKIIFGNNVTNLRSIFNLTNVGTTIDCSEMDTSNVTSMWDMFSTNTTSDQLTTIIFSNKFKGDKVTTVQRMFQTRSHLTSIDLKYFNTPVLVTTAQMFQACTNLMFIDIREMIFDNVTSSANMFDGVPTNCEIIVKDATQKAWINTNFPTMTNVKTVAEYET